jgi:hypothetical protein
MDASHPRGCGRVAAWVPGAMVDRRRVRQRDGKPGRILWRMPCSDSPVVCQLRAIVAALQPGWDWNSFWATFIATVAGVVISGLLAYWVLRRQLHDQYKARLDDAFVKVLYAENETFRELETLNTSKGDEIDPTDLGSNPHGLLTALFATRLLARRKDRDVVVELQSMLHNYHRMRVSSRIVIGQSLVGTIAEWRSGALTPQQAITEARRAATAMNQFLAEGKA